MEVVLIVLFSVKRGMGEESGGACARRVVAAVK